MDKIHKSTGIIFISVFSFLDLGALVILLIAGHFNRANGLITQLSSLLLGAAIAFGYRAYRIKKLNAVSGNDEEDEQHK